MTSSINRVLIVGGGTAGWLTAGILANQLNSNDPQAVQVTLVESPNIPILGVGEGTWPNLRATLQKLGVDETEFMRQCDATFKQGSEFINWMQPKEDKTHRYFHPLNAVYHAAYDINLAPYWLQGQAGDGVGYDQAVATQAAVCRAGLAPKKITTPAYEAIQNYAYHLNANKFASFLAEHCTSRLGVKHILANVTQVSVSETGWIESVSTDKDEVIHADFFIDCSGSKGLLIEQALQVSWHSISDCIFNDTAMAIQVPNESDNCPIATHTMATATDSGWIWDIGLQHRRGIGHVYSSHHCSDDMAETALRNYIGDKADELSVRKIKMKTGYRDTFWKNNCVAIGMSAAFIEPLEASAIFLTDAAATMLAEQFPRNIESVPLVCKKFNQTFQLRWEKTLDFIKLHYCISDRRDSRYWIDNCQQASIPESLQQKLAHWRYHPPSKYDFEYAFEPFVLDSYLFVLYGMNFPTDIRHNLSSYPDTESAKQHFSNIQAMGERLKRELPSQRELVSKVYQFGFQSL